MTRNTATWAYRNRGTKMSFYGSNSAGIPYDPAKCAQPIWPSSVATMGPYQCKRKPIAGSLWCKQHAPDA